MATLTFTPAGIYCPAGDFYIDPWRPVARALITHGHADHARSSMGAYLATDVAAPVMRHRLGDIPIETIAYGEKRQIGGATVSFHPAGHVPGSAQIRVEVAGEVWVASGDYKVVDDGLSTPFEPVTCHHFITESTFGLPIYTWPDQADLAAQIAANETGAAELRKITRQFGVAGVHAYMGHVQDNAEESVRRVLDVLRDSSFVYPLDDGAQIAVDIKVDRATRSATLDFTGTSAQSPLNYNAPLAICRAVVLYVFRTLVGSDIPMNEGCMKPLHLIVPEGTMINPHAPAAVISGNTEVSQAIADALYGALGVVAGSQGTMNNFVYGNDQFQNYETICGGTGAGPDFDGTSAVHSHMPNTRMPDPEVLETRFPVRVETFAIRDGSGGSGRQRGGNGILRRLRFLEPMTVTVLSSHRVCPPLGCAGGAPGAVGRNAVQRSDGRSEPLGGNDRAELGAGDVFVMETPGGGGFGVADDSEAVWGTRIWGCTTANVLITMCVFISPMF